MKQYTNARAHAENKTANKGAHIDDQQGGGNKSVHVGNKTATKSRISQNDATRPVRALAQIQGGVVTVASEIRRDRKRSMGDWENEGAEERISPRFCRG